MDWRIFRSLILAFLLSSVGCAQTDGASTDRPPPARGPQGDYAIYSAVLDLEEAWECFGESPEYLVLLQVTRAFDPFPSTSPQDETVDRSEPPEWLSEAFPGLERETFLDYMNKNRTSARLTGPFLTRFDVVLTTWRIEDQYGKSDRDPWEGFYEKYPRSSGFITLSRVGYNKARDQALVHFSRWQGVMSGSGYLVFLTRVNDTWSVVALETVEIG